MNESEVEQVTGENYNASRIMRYEKYIDYLVNENAELKATISKMETTEKELKEKIESLKGFEEIQKKIWEMFGSFAELKQLYNRERL